MRLHIKCSKSNSPVNFNHQHLIAEAVHDWMQVEEQDAELALYSFSMLTNGKAANGALKFTHGTSFYISAHGNFMHQRIIEGIEDDPELFSGISAKEVKIIEEPDFSNQEIFHVASPIFIKRKIKNNVKHVTFKSEKAGIYLTESLKAKMKKVGMTDDTLEISFMKDYRGAKERLVSYDGQPHKSSWCPVIIKAKAETKLFAWQVGLGDYTGLGFGALK